MNFNLSQDQEALVLAVDKIAAAFALKPADFNDFALAGGALERELQDGGYFDIAAVPEWGSIGAVMAVERLARCPHAVETALSMLVRAHLPDDAPRPVALAELGRPGRFIVGAKTVVVVDGDGIGIAHPTELQTQRVESIFAYPMGRLTDGVIATPLSPSEAERVRQWLQVAIAAEISGLLQAAISSTVEHIGQRRQFGRPLGSFQALRHRMAECAVLAGGVKWLALKAADSAARADAALAACHAQDSAVRIAYECHQMLGAMGMTLEHPLHLWTYRLKALISELGGRCGQAAAAAAACFEGTADGDLAR